MKKGKTILIVDDNMNFVDRIIGLLEDVSNISHTFTAGDYDEASLLINREKPDVVLLDINIPGKNGIEVLRFIRKNNKDCEVIMITNHADEYYRQQCVELGAKYFLDKSSDFAQVPVIIANMGFRNSKNNE